MVHTYTTCAKFALLIQWRDLILLGFCITGNIVYLPYIRYLFLFNLYCPKLFVLRIVVRIRDFVISYLNCSYNHLERHVVVVLCFLIKLLKFSQLMKIFDNFLTFGNYTSCTSKLCSYTVTVWVDVFWLSFLCFVRLLLNKIHIPTCVYSNVYAFIHQEDKCILLQRQVHVEEIFRTLRHSDSTPTCYAKPLFDREIKNSSLTNAL